MESEINLLDLVITFAKHKKLILGAPLAAAIITIVFTFFSPDIYTADTQLLPPQQQSGASAMLSQLGALSGRGFAAGGKNPNDIYIAMLKSRTLRDSMIRRFKLQSIYKTNTPGATRAALAGVTTIVSGKDGLITVQVDDKSPQRAAMLANGYAEALQKMTQVFAVTDASRSRLFFEKQMQQAKESLINAETALKKLQEKTGIIQLDAQAGLSISTGAGIQAQIAEKEVELGTMRTFATGNNPDYIRTQQILAGLRQQLAKVETGAVITSKVPETGLEYIRKLRDLKYAETIYEMLAKQYEMAKIDEAKESSVIQVLDKAVVPEQKSKPKRSTTVLIAGVVAGVLAMLWAFLAEALQRANKDSANLSRLQSLREHLRWR